MSASERGHPQRIGDTVWCQTSTAKMPASWAMRSAIIRRALPMLDLRARIDAAEPHAARAAQRAPIGKRGVMPETCDAREDGLSVAIRMATNAIEKVAGQHIPTC